MSLTPEQEPKVPCPVCGREIATYVPKGGDGSLSLMRPHIRPGEGRCPGSKRDQWGADR